MLGIVKRLGSVTGCLAIFNDALKIWMVSSR